MKKPSIYFVATEFGEIHHGPAVYTRNLWDFFRNSDEFDFHLVVLQSNEKHPRIHVHESNSTARKNFYSRLESHIRNVIPTDDPGLILHVNSAHLLSPSLARRYRTVVQVNDTEVCQHRWTFRRLKQCGIRRMLALSWRKWRERSVVRQAEMTVCNSNFTKMTVQSHYGLPENTVQRVYKAVRLSAFLSVHPGSNETCDPKLIFIGNNWQRKGLSVLIDAVRILSREQPELPVTVDVFGAPTSSVVRKFRNLATSAGVQKKFRFRGLLSREDAPAALLNASMLVLPSFEEALGLVAIEALAVGIPVVGSRVGGIPEVVDSEILGTLTQPGEPRDLAVAILRHLQVPLVQKHVELRKRSSQRFDTDTLGKTLTLLYRSLLQSG